MSKDIKKALEHCIEWNCADCPNREELGSGETVCRGRLLTYILECVADLEAKLAESEDKCNKQWLQIQADTEHIQRLEQQLAELEVKNDKLGTELCNADNIVSYLQQQLAEKEEQIKMLEEHKFYADNIIQAYADKCKNADQDKISFVVEQINTLVSMLTDRAELIKTNSRESAFVFDVHDLSMCSQDLIEQLKEGK